MLDADRARVQRHVTADQVALAEVRAVEVQGAAAQFGSAKVERGLGHVAAHELCVHGEERVVEVHCGLDERRTVKARGALERSAFEGCVRAGEHGAVEDHFAFEGPLAEVGVLERHAAEVEGQR
ncbi:hypothetical protein [Lentzea sp. NPDC004782]|uniref:hypothetical protein n=1 Tax=Lentzea sp. NPDC004782 TaxID=3154458 RepID=UPI0033A77A04